MKKLLTILLVATLAGCASSGNHQLAEESRATVSTKIIEGQTTQGEVRSMFGDPAETTFTDGGLEIWKYDFADVSLDAVSYIPIVNMFGSSASGVKKELTILYDESGVVKRYSMNSSEVSQKSGIFK